MAVENQREHEMLVQIRWQGRKEGSPSLATERHRSRPINGEAIGDWSYWVARGYSLYFTHGCRKLTIFNEPSQFLLTSDPR